jgi:hypothetical protein
MRTIEQIKADIEAIEAPLRVVMDRDFPPGTPNRRNLYRAACEATTAKRNESAFREQIETLYAELLKVQRATRRKALASVKAADPREQMRRRFHGLARRLKNVGLRVTRSDRSETVYVSITATRDLRISGHELGYADYGTRQQSHRGPEVVSDLSDLAATVAACIEEVREYTRNYSGDWTAFERSSAAATLCGLRRLSDKIS